MMVRLCVQTPALAAFDYNTMRIVMADIHQKLGLAGSASIGLVAAAFTHRATRRMLKNVGPRSGVWRQKYHVELGHRSGLVGNGSGLIAHTAQGWPKYQRRMGICG
jgi:hypothetical protein